jgi:hypothetical protein
MILNLQVSFYLRIRATSVLQVFAAEKVAGLNVNLQHIELSHSFFADFFFSKKTRENFFTYYDIFLHGRPDTFQFAFSATFQRRNIICLISTLTPTLFQC